jgi:hypothetical protein
VRSLDLGTKHWRVIARIRAASIFVHRAKPRERERRRKVERQKGGERVREDRKVERERGREDKEIERGIERWRETCTTLVISNASSA